MKQMDETIDLLTKVHSDYRAACQVEAQGWLGKRREEKLIKLLEALFKNPENPIALTNLFKFVIDQGKTSRLRRFFMEAFFEIFELKLPTLIPMIPNPNRKFTTSYGLAFSSLYENCGQYEQDKKKQIEQIKEEYVKQAIKAFQLNIQDKEKALKPEELELSAVAKEEKIHSPRVICKA